MDGHARLAVVCWLTCGDLSLSENSRSTSVALLTNFAPCARSLLPPLEADCFTERRRFVWFSAVSCARSLLPPLEADGRGHSTSASATGTPTRQTWARTTSSPSAAPTSRLCRRPRRRLPGCRPSTAAGYRVDVPGPSAQTAAARRRGADA
eukprot:3083484-Prymnesium_polylepis.1